MRRVSDLITETARASWPSDLTYVECLHCDQAFHADVLNDPSDLGEAGMLSFRAAMVGVMVTMMDSDGTVRPSELDAMTAIYSELAGGQVSERTMDDGIALARASGSDASLQVVREVNPILDMLGRELVFRAALYISAADGEIHQQEMDYLELVGSALGLQKRHLRSIIRSAQDSGHVVLGAGRA